MPAKFSDDDWGCIFGLRVGIPAHVFPYVLNRIGHQLYCLSNEAYAIVWPLPYIKDKHPADCARVARVFWAKNFQAAKLIGYHHPRVDRRVLVEGSCQPPPNLLRGQAASWKNRHTYAAARALKSVIPESAEYNGWGEFKYKVVWLPQLQVYYATRQKREAELPLGVEVLLHSSGRR